MKIKLNKHIFGLSALAVLIGLVGYKAVPDNFICTQTTTYQSSPGSEMVKQEIVQIRDFSGLKFSVKKFGQDSDYSPFLSRDITVDNLTDVSSGYSSTRTFYVRGITNTGTPRYLVVDRLKKEERIITNCEKN